MQTKVSNNTKALWYFLAFLALYGAAQTVTEATAIFVVIPVAALIVLIVFSHQKSSDDVSN
jgi:hypothetical protein